MIRSLHSSLPLFLLVIIALVLAHAVADAQVRPITFNLDTGDAYTLENRPAVPALNLESVVQVEGTVVVEFVHSAGNQAVPLAPQKDGAAEQTYTGLTSDFSPWGGTITAVYDEGSGKLQLTGGGNIVPQITGIYCPQEFPTHSGDNDDAQCPAEADAQYGFSLGVPGGGSVEAASRDWIGEVIGQSDINGTEIDTLNWHYFVLQSNHDFDDTGALDGNFDTDTLQVPDPPGSAPIIGHNENDPDAGLGTVDESTYYKGNFSVAAGQASISVPFNATYFIRLNNAGDDNGDGIPDQHIRLLLSGELIGSGAVGTELTAGDANQDGVVDGLDVNILSMNLGRGANHVHAANTLEFPEGHSHYGVWTTGDFNFDTIVDETDLALLIANFGAGAGGGSGTVVPEPGSFLLAAIAMSGLLLLRRRSGLVR